MLSFIAQGIHFGCLTLVNTFEGLMLLYSIALRNPLSSTCQVITSFLALNQDVELFL